MKNCIIFGAMFFLFAPNLLAQSREDLLVDCFNQAVEWQEEISAVQGDTVRVPDRPLHWKVSVQKRGLVLEKGGNVAVSGVLWYSISTPGVGVAFLWTPGGFGKVFTPDQNYLLAKLDKSWVLRSNKQLPSKRLLKKMKKILKK